MDAAEDDEIRVTKVSLSLSHFMACQNVKVFVFLEYKIELN